MMATEYIKEIVDDTIWAIEFAFEYSLGSGTYSGSLPPSSVDASVGQLPAFTFGAPRSSVGANVDAGGKHRDRIKQSVLITASFLNSGPNIEVECGQNFRREISWKKDPVRVPTGTRYRHQARWWQHNSSKNLALSKFKNAIYNIL